MSATFDVRIVNGTLIDGNGTPGVHGDLGIKDGRITAMGKVEGSASQTIDADGQAVAPGFVDIHTHYDAQAFWDPSLSPSCYYGVTSVVCGNCGFSIAPLSGKADDADYLMRMLARVEGMPLESLRAGASWDWKSFDDFLARIDNTTAINVGVMVGHSALRRTVMGERAVGNKATPDELAGMQALLRASLRAGGLGFSSSINTSHNDGDGNPVPSRHASYDEIVALAQVAGEFEGTTLEFLPIITNVFPEEQLDLMTRLSKAANRPVNWNLLVPSSSQPEMFRSHLGSADYAAKRGGRVVPLVATKSNVHRVNFVAGFMLDSIKGWDRLMKKSLEERMKMLADPAERRALGEAAMNDPRASRDHMRDVALWELEEIFNPEVKRFQGMKAGEIGRQMGKEPFDAMIEVIVADQLKTTIKLPQRATDDESWRMRAQGWMDERTIVGASDSGAHLDMNDSFTGMAVILSEAVRDRKLITLERAVREFTSAPARLVGLKGRGELKVGNHADVVVFDPKTVGCGKVYSRRDLPAGAARLYSDAIGVSHVLVNGREILRDNQLQGVFPGRVLRSGRDTYTVTAH